MNPGSPNAHLDRSASRRQFLRGDAVVGGAAALAAILAACGAGAPAPQATTSTSPPVGVSGTSGTSVSSAATPASQGAAAPTAAPAGQTPKRGGTLRYGLSTDPSNLEPHVSTGAASGSVKIMVYSTLLTYDPQGN